MKKRRFTRGFYELRKELLIKCSAFPSRTTFQNEEEHVMEMIATKRKIRKKSSHRYNA